MNRALRIYTRFRACSILNGDGKLEVIVHSQYYEGAATTIYDCSGGKCKDVLSVFCGL